MPRPLRLIDLFAGAGGMTQGFKNVGTYEVVQAVELDRSAAATYSMNHGRDHLFFGDIRDWLDTGAIPAADVVIGGPPCQGFSALGRRDTHDVRNFLWEQYARTISAARPKAFVLENVAQFLTSPQFQELVHKTEPGEELENYELQSWVLNAAEYGAFQARKRAVVVGRLRGTPPLELPEPLPKNNWRTVRQAFHGLARATGSVSLPSRSVLFDSKSIAGPFASWELHLSRTYAPQSLERFSHIPPGGNRHDLPSHLLAPCWVGHKTGSGDVMGRLHWDKPSVTIRTEFFKPEKGRYLHPSEDRSLSHLEASRLQGFPDDYLWAGSKTAIARQIGNAVPVPLSKMLAELVSLHLAHADHPKRVGP